MLISVMYKKCKIVGIGFQRKNHRFPDDYFFIFSLLFLYLFFIPMLWPLRLVVFLQAR